MADEQAVPQPVDRIEDKPIISKWQFAVLVALLMLGLAGGARLLSQASTDHKLLNNTYETLAIQRAESARRDCVTQLVTARNSVFQDMDIYKAELISGAAYQMITGVPLPQAAAEFLKGEAAKLAVTLVEARRLQPAHTLDDLIAHGGVVAGVHYDACH